MKLRDKIIISVLVIAMTACTIYIQASIWVLVAYYFSFVSLYSFFVYLYIQARTKEREAALKP